MHIHFLQHVFFETPGYIEPYLKLKGHRLSFTFFFEDSYCLPESSSIDGLVIMGGPMGVDDEEQFPWLKEEKKFIQSCIDAGKHVLGICLGAQLIARSLSAPVKPAPNKEIGWYPLFSTGNSSRATELLDLFQENPVVFHWHGDRFEIPDVGFALPLVSEANDHQMLCVSKKVLGLQFHLEITEESLGKMLDNGAGDLKQGKYIQNREKLLEGKQYIGRCNRIMAKLLDYWLQASVD